MADLDQIAASLNTLLARYGVTRDQMADLLAGPADGGPNGDGLYPVTLADGSSQILVPSPRRIAKDGEVTARLEIAPAGRQPTTVRSSDAKVVEQIDVRDAYAGTGTATRGAPRRFLGTLPPSGDDSALLIGRDLVGDRLFSHAIRDESSFLSINDSAYCSYDAAYSVGGASAYNHFRGYQWRTVFSGTGSVGELNGFGSQPVVASGHVSVLYGVHIFNPQKSPGATIDLQAGVYVDLLSGAGANYGIYVAGNASYLGGPLQIAGPLTGVTTIAASGQMSGSSAHVTGTIAAYLPGGGLLTAGIDGGSGYGALMAYADASGAARGLTIHRNGGAVVIGQATAASGAALQVNGDIAPTTDNARSLGSASLRFSTVYAGTGTISTSDERAKDQIGAIPDAWLDAWGAVEWCRFRFRGGDRWHVGLIAQRVHAAFAAAGLDAFKIGLCCHDEWPDHVEQVDGADARVTAAGDRWGLRYDECFALEAAWQRRELAQIRAVQTVAR